MGTRDRMKNSSFVHFRVYCNIKSSFYDYINKIFFGYSQENPFCTFVFLSIPGKCFVFEYMVSKGFKTTQSCLVKCSVGILTFFCVKMEVISDDLLDLLLHGFVFQSVNDKIEAINLRSV